MIFIAQLSPGVSIFGPKPKYPKQSTMHNVNTCWHRNRGCSEFLSLVLEPISPYHHVRVYKEKFLSSFPLSKFLFCEFKKTRRLEIQKHQNLPVLVPDIFSTQVFLNMIRKFTSVYIKKYHSNYFGLRLQHHD